MPVVSNATPLIYLAKAHRLELLKKTYHQVYVCPDVWIEVIQPIFTTRPIPEDIPIILKARSDEWLKMKHVETRDALAIRDELLKRGFGAGEANSIALAKDLNTMLLANDEAAILAAIRYGLKTRWFTEILHDALKAGRIKNVKEYTDLLDECIAKGLYLSRKAREDAIRIANDIAGR